MRRVSSGQANLDVQNNLRRQERNLNKVNNQLGSQQRIQSLRDDPIAAGHLVRYQSYAKRIEQFKHNAETISDQFILSEGYVDHSLQIMHRVRELAVTGAHGVYNKDDLANMAAEVDELLKEIIQNANALDADGNALLPESVVKIKPSSSTREYYRQRFRAHSKSPLQWFHKTK